MTPKEIFFNDKNEKKHQPHLGCFILRIFLISEFLTILSCPCKGHVIRISTTRKFLVHASQCLYMGFSFLSQLSLFWHGIPRSHDHFIGFNILEPAGWVVCHVLVTLIPFLARYGICKNMLIPLCRKYGQQKVILQVDFWDTKRVGKVTVFTIMDTLVVISVAGLRWSIFCFKEIHFSVTNAQGKSTILKQIVL